MSHVMIRPNLRTAGGEMNDVMLNGRYTGALTLVYREGERLSGSLQLEEPSLHHRDKHKVLEHVRTYIQAIIDAYDLSECDVVVTYSQYDEIIATDYNIGDAADWSDEEAVQESVQPMDYEYDYVTEDPQVEDFEYDDMDESQWEYDLASANAEENPTKVVFYELMIVGESRSSVEYHIYDHQREWVAEAFMTIYGMDVIGEVNWTFHPSDEEIGHVTQLIVSDFDDQAVDTFLMNIKHKGKLIATEELTHEELISGTDDYSVVLIRDDMDTLTFEIYRESYGNMPIGTATIDMSHNEVTGFIEFAELENEQNREHIATLLMSELDKGKDYDIFNLTMLHNNQHIDEIMFASDEADIH